MGRITSEREDKYKYKGTAPMNIDRYTLFLFKTIFQVPIFVLLYIVVISQVHYADAFYFVFMLILWVFIILLISDIVSHVLAWWVNKTMIHRWGYILSPKKKKERLRASITYMFYVFFRALVIVFGIVWVITRSFIPFFGGWSFLFAWIFISIICRALSTFITDYGVFRV